MEAMSWLGVVRATPQRPLPSLLGPERLGFLIAHFKYILMRRARVASIWLQKHMHFLVTRITSQTVE